jgi:hypothetical protein
LFLVGMTAPLGLAGSIFFNSQGNSGDVQLILNGITTLNASNTGWYTNSGATNQPGGTNYITGLCSNCGGDLFRDFFVFAIPAEIAITSASLNVNTYVYDSVNPTETLSLFDVTTPFNTLVGGTGGLAAYNDLGSGVVYGSRVYTAADQNLFRSFSLNAAALSAIQQSSGGSFIMGGALASVSVPEPATWALMAGVLSLLAARHATKRTGRP